MIPKGMKVGDTFVDGGVTHEVLEVVGQNYISKVVEDAPTITFDSTEDYESMQYAQLKKLCAERGLDATGKKADLVARLEG